MAIQDYLSDIQSYTGGASAASDKASQQYAEASGAGATLPMKLKEALGAKLNYNKDIIEQQNSAMGDYFAAPAVAREKYQGVWNPFEREKLVATARSQAYQPYANFTDILGQRMGTVSDIVGQGVAGWQSVVQQAAAIAQAAQAKYQSVLNEYLSAAGMQEKDDTRAQAKSQYDQTLAWDKTKFALEQAAKKGGGSGTGIPGVSKVDEETAKVWMQIEENSYRKEGNNEVYDPNIAWAIINRNQDAYRLAGIDVQALWTIQRRAAPLPKANTPMQPAISLDKFLNPSPNAPVWGVPKPTAIPKPTTSPLSQYTSNKWY